MARTSGRTTRGIYYEFQANPGKPTLLLVMGYASGLASWGERFLSVLAERCAFVIIDNRGTGQSVKPDSDAAYAVPELARDAFDVLDALALTSVHLVGYSLGGCIAQEMALTAPSRFTSLHIVSSTAGGANFVSPGAEILKALANPQGTELLDFFVSGWELCMGKATTARLMPELKEIFAEQSRHLTPRHVMRGQIVAFRAFDSGRRLPALRLPTTVISGATDPLIPAENSQRLAKLIPGARLEILDDVGHNPHIECPERYVSLLVP